MHIIVLFFSVTGFSPYFLMFGQTPKIPLGIDMGVTLTEQGDVSYQNYVKKLRGRLEWAYQVAHENNQKSLNASRNIMIKG